MKFLEILSILTISSTLVTCWPQRHEFRRSVTCTSVDPTTGEQKTFTPENQNQNPSNRNQNLDPITNFVNNFRQPLEIFGQQLSQSLGPGRGQGHHRRPYQQTSTEKSTSFYFEPSSSTTTKQNLFSSPLPELQDKNPNKKPDNLNLSPKPYEKEPLNKEPKPKPNGMCSDLGELGRMYKKDGKCYQAGFQGPCPEHMSLYPDPSDPDNYAFCDCINHLGVSYRPIVTFEDSKCYPVFDQGPCQKGEWLVPKKKDFEGQCEKKTCPESVSIAQFTVQVNGTCYSHDTQASCQKDELLLYNELSIEPKCTKEKDFVRPQQQRHISSVPDIGCPSGQKKTASGNCARLPSF